jgi:hypothetical protein
MSEYKGPERRFIGGNADEQFSRDVAQTLIRITREGIPIEQAEFREEGRKHEKLIAAIRERAFMLIGYGSQRPPLDEGTTPASSAHEATTVMPPATIADSAAETPAPHIDGTAIEPALRDPAIERQNLLPKFEAQFSLMQATLDRYEISMQEMPTWEQISMGLTQEVLEKALLLAEPTLLLVPPTTRKEKVEAINRNPSEWHKHETVIFRITDDSLWDSGNANPANKWRILIVDGVQNVEQDSAIFNGKRKNFEIVKQWVKKYEEQGLKVMNDADAYLVLTMKGQTEEKPVDTNTKTVLNGANLKPEALVAYGSGGDRVDLLYDQPDNIGDSFRLRGMIEVAVTGI